MQYIDDFDVIVVFLDNQGLVTQLEADNARSSLAQVIHGKIFQQLRVFKKPFTFYWLPRDNHAIQKADSIGRGFNPASPDIPPHFIQHLEQYFSVGNIL